MTGSTWYLVGYSAPQLRIARIQLINTSGVQLRALTASPGAWFWGHSAFLRCMLSVFVLIRSVQAAPRGLVCRGTGFPIDFLRSASCVPAPKQFLIACCRFRAQGADGRTRVRSIVPLALLGTCMIAALYVNASIYADKL